MFSLVQTIRERLPRRFDDIVYNDATGGIVMLFCTVIALILQNGSFSTSYRHILEVNAGIVFGDFSLIKPLLLWINDGLITIFFFSIGLELKIEFIKGHLADKRNIILPGLAAVGGIIAPSLVFILFNYSDDFAMRGWAIPTATDTAFSVGLLMLLGSRVPASLKIFLLSMAIFDDIGAILVIALFYTSQLSIASFATAAVAIVGLALLNFFGSQRKMVYIIFGVLLWFAILKSGVHATLAGIITAFFIPMKGRLNEPMVEPIFENLKLWVALVVLPIFTLANAGIDLSLIDIKDFFSPVSLGIFFGLFLGKQLGIFGIVMLCFKLRLVKIPSDVTILQMYGVCILTGIGFSMSMFIDTLAYQGSSVFNYSDSLAILLASLCSGLFGYFFLRFVACKTLAITYRPWLPAPVEVRTGESENLVQFDFQIPSGPASVAPTAAAVATANARKEAADNAKEVLIDAGNIVSVANELTSKVVSDELSSKLQEAVAQVAQAMAETAQMSSQLEKTTSSQVAEELDHLTDITTQSIDSLQEILEQVSASDLKVETDENSEEAQDPHSEKPQSILDENANKVRQEQEALKAEIQQAQAEKALEEQEQADLDSTVQENASSKTETQESLEPKQAPNAQDEIKEASESKVEKVSEEESSPLESISKIINQINPFKDKSLKIEKDISGFDYKDKESSESKTEVQGEVEVKEQQAKSDDSSSKDPEQEPKKIERI